MKQRITTAIFALVILAVAFLCYNTMIFNLFIALLSSFAVFELLSSTKYVKNKSVLVASCVYAFIIPFFIVNYIALTALYLIFLLVILLCYHQNVRFEEIAISFFVSLLIPIAFSTTVFIRDRYETDGLFFILLICAAAWLTDTGAYFIGCSIGKHKLAPVISPKKTVEGAIGGLVVSLVFFILFCVGYRQFRNGLIEINYLNAIIVALVCSIVGMIGDLLASVIKRQTEIKDYGNILPGHGGVLDRFDSFLLTAPVFCVLIQLLPIF